MIRTLFLMRGRRCGRRLASADARMLLALERFRTQMLAMADAGDELVEACRAAGCPVPADVAADLPRIRKIAREFSDVVDTAARRL